MAKDAEIQPPWRVRRSMGPGNDPYWRTDEGRNWLRDVFLPFYDRLSNEEQISYCRRWNAPPPWVSLFLHPDLDEAFYEADKEDFGEAAPPLDYRKIFGVDKKP